MRRGPARTVLRHGTGPRLICLPFAGGTSGSYSRLADQLGAAQGGGGDPRATGPGDWHVIGAQPPGDPVPDLDGLAKHYLDLLGDDLLGGPGLLLGHSMGASVAHHMAQLVGDAWPDDVHLVLSAPPRPGSTADDLLALDGQGLLDEARRRGLLPPLRRITDDVAVRMLLPTLRHDLEAVGAAGWRLGPATAPVHLLGGELDPAVPPAAVRELAARIRPRSLRFVPGGAHMYVVEHPAETADALRSLWRERERESGRE